MNIDRRNFIQKMGIGAGVGFLPDIPLITSGSNYTNSTSIVVSENNAVVETNYGKVRGYTRKGIHTFKGIPYAASTADRARFLPPAKPPAWTGVRNSLVYGPVCPQKPNAGWGMEEYAFLYQWNDGVQGEDCLRLNIWSPGINDNKERPVMLWIHGGGFFSGSSQEHPSYDGENLSRRGDIVVVSVNHRLNAFGFMNLSNYGEQYESSGNVGMLDLVAALEWIKGNINAFGGNADNVTIYGQSGGAAKVTTLMAMPSAKGLFHKAIAQSSSTIRVATHEYSQKLSEALITELGLNKSTISEIHKVPFRSIVEAGISAEKKIGKVVPSDVGRAGWQPIVDGKILPTHPFDPEVPAFSSHIPMIIGTNRNESAVSIGNTDIESLDEEGLKQKLLEKYGSKSEDLYKILRKINPYVKPVEILTYLSPYNVMAYKQADKKVAQKTAQVFLYMFKWKTPLMDGRPRAFHCSEIPFIFDNTDRSETMTGGGEEARELGKNMSKAWINFAYTGNPNHKDLPMWPAYSSEEGETMFFDKKSEVKNDPDREFRKALERSE